MINPDSLILMLRHKEWWEAADAVEHGSARTIQQKRVVYDLKRHMHGAARLLRSEFGKAIVYNL